MTAQSFVLDVAFAQTLCEMLAGEFDHVVSVMGEGGRILASSDKSRVGSVHEVATEVMAGRYEERGVTRAEARRSSVMREGYIKALVVDGVRVGAISVIGAVDVARRFVRVAEFVLQATLRLDAMDRARQRAEESRTSELRMVGDALDRDVAGVAEEVSRAAGEIAGAAQAVAKANQEADTLMASTLTSVDTTSTNIGAISAAVGELTESIQAIERDMSVATERSDRAVTEARAAKDIMQRLQDATVQIGDILKLINAVAAQTNMLALNATIEAARAGDAGRGFAVVAGEVKALANQTAQATDKIAQQMDNLRRHTGEAVAALERIGEGIRSVDEVNARVAKAVGEQSQATGRISDNAQLASHAAQDMAQQVQRVGATTRRVIDAFASVDRAAGVLRQKASKLTDGLAAVVGLLKR